MLVVGCCLGIVRDVVGVMFGFGCVGWDVSGWVDCGG